MSQLVNIKGLDELQKLLDTLPAKLESNVMRGALRAGASVIREQAKANVPVGRPSAKNARLYGAYAGALRDSIKLSVSLKRGVIKATIRAGGKKSGGADVYYATMVEMGTKPHKIKGRNGHALSFAGGLVQSVAHPGSRSRPYMRPAFDAKAQAAIVAAAEYIKNRLSTKQGLDTAGISIGIES